MTDARAARALLSADLDGVWSAPGRVNLIGEHTDYNDGFVFPFAIDRRTVVAARRRSDRRIVVASTFSTHPVDIDLDDLPAMFPAYRDKVSEWSRYPLGVAWALIAAAEPASGVTSGVELAFASDVPVGAGLSSSAAIEAAAAVALDGIWGLGLDRTEMARAGRLAENLAVGAPTGIMDQMAALYGAPDAGVFLDCRSLDARVTDLGFRTAGLEIIVIDTHVTHAHATGGYRDRRADCERGAAELGVRALRDLTIADLDRARGALDDVTFRRVRHIVTENQRTLDTVSTLATEGPRAIGRLLEASHVSLRDDFEVSIPQLDLAVAAARDAGALGARMTGGGFGGSAIALAEAGDTESISRAVKSAFANAGFSEPHIFAVRPSDGARRDE